MRSELTASSAWIASTAFVVAIFGSNAMTPLIPLYQRQIGLSALDSAMVFAMYFVPLVAVLLIGAHTSLARYARLALPVAMVTALGSDILLVFGAQQPVLLYVGRFLVGLSAALATASVASIAVAGRGERGRLLVAWASMLGAGGGLALAIAIVALAPAQLVTVYAVNGVAAGVCAIALITDLRRGPILLTDRSDASAATVPSGQRSFARALWFAVGAVGWAVGGLMTGVFPAALVDANVVDSPTLALSICGAALFAAAVVGPFGLAERVFPTVPVTSAALVVGMAAFGFGAWLTNSAALIGGSIIAGVAQLAAYRWGLNRATEGLGPVGQGRTVSAYAASAYCGAGIFVVGGGALVQTFGPAVGLIAGCVVFAVVAVAVGWAAAATRPPTATPLDRSVDAKPRTSAGIGE